MNGMTTATETHRERNTAGSLLYGTAARCRGAFGAGARRGVLALVDQAVVSGGRFAATVMIGRTCGPEQLGTYSLGFTFLMLIACAQESLISLPYTIYTNRLQGRSQTEHAGAAVIHYGMLASLTSLCLALLATVLLWATDMPQLAAVIGVLAFTMPCMLLVEFARRLAFAHLRMTTALLVDVAMAAILIGGLFSLAAAGVLSAATAYAVMGLAGAVAGGVWLLRNQSLFALRRDRILPELRRSWTFGRWVFASQMAFVARGYVVPWLLAMLVATSATGVLFACQTIVLFCNPFLLGVGNVLTPSVARASARGGDGQVRRVVVKATLLLGAITAALCGLLVLLGNPLLLLLYGSEFAGHQVVIAVLAGTILAEALGMAAYNGLWSMERPGATFAANLLGLLATTVTTLALVVPWGVLGAACGLLAGRVVATVVQCTVFFSAVRPAASNEPLSVIHTDAAETSGNRRWQQVAGEAT